MTITQLEYVVAVDKFRHFGKAAESCGVTQPTLSMQIQRLEEEWKVSLFDRSRKPICPTKVGEKIIRQMQVILHEARRLEDVIQLSKGMYHGVFRIGVIPTVSPYLLHRIILPFQKAFPEVRCVFQEAHTDQLLQMIKDDEIDVGILATPLREAGLQEMPLYYESFMAFLHAGHRLAGEAFVLNSELSLDDMLLLSEGHCFRNSVINMCDANRGQSLDGKLVLESGNFETLIRLVKQGHGMTLIPYLMALDLDEKERKWVRPVAEPRPVREIGLLYAKTQLKVHFIKALAKIIRSNVPEKMLTKDGKVLSPR
ncbi:MAG: LysR family transcriptional regulator [Cryomorphaceae bacterium]|nr:LysR family transcriptional regulator [Cryomorphaceae bacterium]